MNKENLTLLADTVEALEPPKFDMRHWLFPDDKNSCLCGTPSCLWGWAEWLRRDKPEKIEITPEYSGNVDEWLGLDLYQSDALFIPEDPTARYSGDHFRRTITPAHAAAVVRHFRDTGEIDWRVGV